MSATTSCYRCGGDMEARSVTHTLTHGERTRIFRHVPAYVCAECGERSFAGAVAARLQRLVRDNCPPTDTVSVEVYDLAAALDIDEAREPVA